MQKSQPIIEDITLKIKTIDNKTFEIKANPTITIHQLKISIEKETNIPAIRQRLLFKGRPLNNSDTIIISKIEDNSVLHLVAALHDSEASPTIGGLSTSSIDEQECRNQFDVQESRKQSRRKVLQQRLHGFPNLPARPFPALHQNVMTLCHLLQSVNTLQESIEQGQIFGCRDYEIGMWVDFKDSLNEWVEASVIGRQQGSVLILHPKGEEWVQLPSSKVAIFRSHTIQKGYHLSPSQNGGETTTFNELLTQTGMLLTRAGHMVSRLADAIDNKKSDISNLISGMIEEQRRNQEEKVEKQDDVTSLKSMKSMKSDKISLDYETSSIKSMKSDISKLTQTFTTHQAIQVENITEEEEDSQDMSEDQTANISREVKENYTYYETSLLAAQLAPIIDRLGRLLVDMAPYIAMTGANITNVFSNNNNNNISNLSIITNEGSQCSGQARQYYFQVPVLLTPIELTQQQANINRIISEQVDIINHMGRQKKQRQQQEEEKPSVLKTRSEVQQQEEYMQQPEQRKKKQKTQKEVSFSQQIDQLKKQNDPK